MKKIISLTLIVVMVLSATFTCFGVNVKINDMDVLYTEYSGVPFIDAANRTQVPLRVTMEDFGCNVDWDGDTRTAIVEKDGTVVKVPIGQSYILVNGVKKTNDTAAVIKDSRTYLPLRAVLEAFGASVSWDQNTQTVIVSSYTNSTHANCALDGLTSYIKNNGKFEGNALRYVYQYNYDADTTQFIYYYPAAGKVEIQTDTYYPAKKMTTVDILVLDSKEYPCTAPQAYFNCYSVLHSASGNTYSIEGTISKSSFVADKTNHFTSVSTDNETVKRIASVGIGLSLLYLEEYCLMRDIDFSASDLGYRNLY
ncbi:MAG: copper amine oxidase N-terminal domain-containing protein [Firmicutes bacterium]|nr:copper amine oxidase N-terminal domain-containing protein [Bacillota bacterium]